MTLCDPYLQWLQSISPAMSPSSKSTLSWSGRCWTAYQPPKVNSPSVQLISTWSWLVVDQPLWKIWKSSWDDYSQLNEKIKNVPNHQPVKPEGILIIRWLSRTTAQCSKNFSHLKNYQAWRSSESVRRKTLLRYTQIMVLQFQHCELPRISRTSLVKCHDVPILACILGGKSTNMSLPSRQSASTSKAVASCFSNSLQRSSKMLLREFGHTC